MGDDVLILRPQPGFQEDAMATSADIAILGGAAGSGKSWLLCFEALRHINNKRFGGLIFRRETPMIRNEGGLWDTSGEIYPYCGAKARETVLEWKFPSGAKMKFSHLQHDSDVLNYQGAQIPYIAFDELTHFTEAQFFYMVSRNRTTCGVKPYVRATCNPDPNSWVARFIEWWIDPITGDPIPERAGKLRYFLRDNDVYIWGDSVVEVKEKAPHLFGEFNGVPIDDKNQVRSVTFIPGKLWDNLILMKKDPAYLGGLRSLPAELQRQLLHGNWLFKPDDLCLFDYQAIPNIFTNYPELLPNPKRYITVDAARFGRDLAVITVWKGWEIIHMSVFKKSDIHDLIGEIERLRAKFSVMKCNTAIDADGVGGGTAKVGEYRAFRNGAKPVRDPDTRIKEDFENFKAQCYYRFAARVNNGQFRANINPETVLVFDDANVKGKYSVQVKIGPKVYDIRDLVKAQMRAIKKSGKWDKGYKHGLNSKEEQKEILTMSPDFLDCWMMRELFELVPHDGTGMTVVNGPVYR